MTTVVVGIKAEDWKGKGEIMALVFAIILSITLAFSIMFWVIWRLYIKNSVLSKNKYQIKLKELKDAEKLKEFKKSLAEKKISKIIK